MTKPTNNTETFNPDHIMKMLSFDGCGINDKRDEYAPRVATFTRKTSAESPDYAKEFGQLFAAAPELLRACQDALEIIQTAKRYFPKSIKNRDTFHLCNIEENSIRSAIRKATGGAQ